MQFRSCCEDKRVDFLFVTSGLWQNEQTSCIKCHPLLSPPPFLGEFFKSYWFCANGNWRKNKFRMFCGMRKCLPLMSKSKSSKLFKISENYSSATCVAFPYYSYIHSYCKMTMPIFNRIILTLSLKGKKDTHFTSQSMWKTM